MAINVQCLQCKTMLELDDGFRGGVCRCSGCGALIQVPRSEAEGVSRGSRPARPDGASASARSGGTGGDLGGSSSGLRSPRPVPNAVHVTRPKKVPSPATKSPVAAPLSAPAPVADAIPKKSTPPARLAIIILIVILMILAAIYMIAHQ